jgi:hypothetical protein
MSALVDFNISTPRNKTQSSNECGVVINNTITNGARERSVEYPSLDPSLTPSVAAQEEPHPQPDYLTSETDALRQENELVKEISLTFARVLKDNNRKLLANLIDQSGKVIVDVTSLCNILAKQLNVPIAMVHVTYATQEPGCLHKVSRIHTVESIKINCVDYRWAYNDKYNRLGDEFHISLSRVIV